MNQEDKVFISSPEAILRSCKDSKEFLRELQSLLINNSSFNYSKFAKKCGFSSRSFVRQLLLGEKPLTLKSARKLSQGLSLDEIHEQILIMLSQKAGESHPIKRAAISNEIREIQSKICKRIEGQISNPRGFPKKNALFWPYVYAALSMQGSDGNPKKNTLEDIQSKTSLPIEIIQSTLETLEKEGLVYYEEGQVVLKNEFLSLDALGKDNFFMSFCNSLLHDVQCKVKNHLGRKSRFTLNECLYASVVSIKKENQTEIARAFQQYVNNFMIDIEDPEGDTTVTLGSFLYHRKFNAL